MGLHHKDVLREILGLSGKKRLQRFPEPGGESLLKGSLAAHPKANR